MRSLNLSRTSRDEDLPMQMSFLYSVKVNTHQLFTTSSTYRNMHQRVFNKMHKKPSPYIDNHQSKVRV